jgi:light-regulated signal transduction histidine kinase (bacteriophytochrome)
MLEHRVHERKRELQRVNAELEEFAASVSHDLQAPLRSIDGYAAMLREDAVDLGDETSRKLKVIVAETARAQGLIGDLLRLARLSRTELRASAVDLTALAQEVIDSLASDCAQRAVVWQLQPLPTVDVDRGLFRQALVNLLANAVKFTAGRDPAVIRIESLPDLAQPGECVLCISDNGAGFDMRYLKRLFGTFQRLHNDREFQGTGVGLANVKRIVERHGGRVWAEGKPGEGARFYIGIPLVSTQD